MFLSDLNFIFQWWFVLFLIGVVFLPITTALFSSFFDRGYIFAKVLGTIVVSYIVFVLGTLHLLRFNQLSVIEILLVLFIVNIGLISKYPNILISFRNSWKIVLFEELLFFATLLFWSYIRSFQPDIHGLEKYMDFGFVNSILRSEYFPPKDMWFTPFSINYYYFGHLYTAVLTKLSGIPSSITYNLMLATLFALTFTGAFSIGLNLMSLLKRRVTRPEGVPSSARRKSAVRQLADEDFFEDVGWDEGAAGPAEPAGPRAILAGLLTAILVSLAGNLHAIYSFFKPYINENPLPFWQLAFSPETFPNAYWYPNATRFIYNTIHEFPIYSFVVSDLHGHVLGIPIVLLIIAVLFSIIQNLKFKMQNYNSKFKIFNFRLQLFTYTQSNSSYNFLLLTLLAFLLAAAYMTNVWDGLIYFVLTALVLLVLFRKNLFDYLKLVVLVIIGSIFFSLPFSLNFKPFVSGIGVLCAPEFLTKIGSFGPFIFEADHCQRSPWWQLLILYGFFYFWVILFLKHLNLAHLSLFKNWKLGIRNLMSSDVFIVLLIILPTLLIILPELIYVKDIYPAHYRANTMFKLGYQAFIMLSIASAYIIMKVISDKQKAIREVPKFFLITCLLSLVSIYSYFAINSYYGNLQVYYGLDGTKYLQRLYPTDYEAILWLNQNIKGQPVVLEAQGDSYTDFARVSANTGLPTVLGWTVHEWLWRGTYAVPAPRIEEVKTLYESKEINTAAQLIKKYNIELVFIGDLERQKYQNLDEQKFQNLGKLIYQNSQTKIYQIQ